MLFEWRGVKGMSGSRSGRRAKPEHRTGEHMAKRTLDASERLTFGKGAERSEAYELHPATWRTDKPPQRGCVSGVVLGHEMPCLPILIIEIITFGS